MLKRTTEFDGWLKGLTDLAGKARILKRLDRAALGNFGDAGPVGDAVHEMRMHFGPGYRAYFTATGLDETTLLNGGDKSTQGADIKEAKRIAKRL